jgi:hypothetical protein
MTQSGTTLISPMHMQRWSNVMLVRVRPCAGEACLTSYRSCLFSCSRRPVHASRVHHQTAGLTAYFLNVRKRQGAQASSRTDGSEKNGARQSVHHSSLEASLGRPAKARSAIIRRAGPGVSTYAEPSSEASCRSMRLCTAASRWVLVQLCLWVRGADLEVATSRTRALVEGVSKSWRLRM